MKKEDVELSTIFLTVAGSRAYNTNTEDSDVDVRGVCVPKDKSYYIGTGINTFGQMDKGFDDDRVVYDLRKFLSLASDSNPNIIELLFVDECKWIKSSPQWLKIIQHRDKFISKLVRYRFGGYAYSQLKRIRNHRRYLLNPPTKKPERSDFGLAAEKVLKKDDIGAFEWLLATFLKRSIQDMNLSDATKQELSELDCIGLVQGNMTGAIKENEWAAIQHITNASDEFISIITREKAYTNALNDWSAYQNWKTGRNEKRRVLEDKYGWDTKHGSHLVRLSRMAMEILEGKGVIVCRPDSEELKAIRNGAWTYDRVEEYAEECDKRMNELYQTTTLPTQPNRVFVDRLCQELIEEYVWSKV